MSGSAGQSPFIQIIPYIILEYFRFVKNFIRICTRILQILFWRISSIFQTAAIGNFDKLFSGNPFDFCRYRYIILRQHRTKTIYWILHVSCLHIFSLAQKSHDYSTDMFHVAPNLHLAQFVLARRDLPLWGKCHAVIEELVWRNTKSHRKTFILYFAPN